MKLQTLLLLLILALIGAFSALNWHVFISPTPLSLGFTSVEMPLGLVMLGFLITLTALFLIFVVYQQTSMLFENRRHTRELQANRELADQAEASRFTELRSYLEGELGRQGNLNAETKTALIARIDRLEGDLRALAEQSENSLSAYIGEMEERLEKTAGRTA